VARVGVITGTATYSLPWLETPEVFAVETPFGDAVVAEARHGRSTVVHVARHGFDHARLSNHVAHRANVAALAQLDVDYVVATTLCGTVDPDLTPGSLVVFDDLYFPSNRLADGSLCTFYDRPARKRAGHWIFDRPYSASLRRILLAAAEDAGCVVRDGGVYGHSDGPRFESRAEIRALTQCGVTAVSQTGGPETILAGEAGLPYALLGYVVNHATGVAESPTAPARLRELLDESTGTLGSVLRAATERLESLAPEPEPAGFVYRFDEK
jgi:5'-methylthioadenosine phosphorylase